MVQLVYIRLGLRIRCCFLSLHMARTKHCAQGCEGFGLGVSVVEGFWRVCQWFSIDRIGLGLFKPGTLINLEPKLAKPQALNPKP